MKNSTENNELKKTMGIKNILKIFDSEEVLEKEVRKAGVPKKYLKSKGSDWMDKVIKPIKPPGIFINGSVGSGKTFLAAEIVRDVIKKRLDGCKERILEGLGSRGYSIDFFADPDSDIASLIDSGELVRFSDIKWVSIFSLNIFSFDFKSPTAPFLVIDDFTAAPTTSKEINHLYQIVYERDSEEKTTIYTSNHSLADIAEKFDDRIASRLSACQQIKIEGKDYRIE